MSFPIPSPHEGVGEPAEEKPQKVSIGQFSKIINVPIARVSVAVRQGRLHASIDFTEKGKPYIKDLALARKEWEDNTSAARTDTGEIKGLSQLTLVEAQRRVAVERGRTLRIARQEKMGLLIRRDRVEEGVYNMLRVYREAMLNLPVRVAYDLAAETDPEKVFNRLNEEVRSALDVMAEEFRKREKTGW